MKYLGDQKLYMEPKNKPYGLPDGWMQKYSEEVQKVSKMSNVLKAMYVMVLREQHDKLHRELKGQTNRDIHIDYL